MSRDARGESELTLLSFAADEIRNVQGFFETTVPRILHPTVKGWAAELYVETVLQLSLLLASDQLFDVVARRMEKRRLAWAARGWTDYKHVSVAQDLPAAVQDL